MSLSNSRLAYSDCYNLMNLALEEPRGVRVQLESKDAAVFMRMRIHQARQIDRRANAETYADDHPLHGCSPYDRLVCRIDDDGYLYIDKQVVNVLSVESIPSDAPTMIEHEPQKALPAPEPMDLGEIQDPESEAKPTPTLRRRV